MNVHDWFVDKDLSILLIYILKKATDKAKRNMKYFPLKKCIDGLFELLIFFIIIRLYISLLISSMSIKSSQTLVEEAKKKIETLSPSEVKHLVEKKEITLIDVRDIRELWKEGTIENSKHIPRGMLEFWLDPESSYYKENKIHNIKKMVLFCALGWRSALATKSLVDMGFDNVAHVDGGFDALKKNGFKVVVKEKK